MKICFYDKSKVFCLWTLVELCNQIECCIFETIIFIGTLQTKKWENCMELDRYSWGYRRNTKLADYFTMHELLSEVAETVRCVLNCFTLVTHWFWMRSFVISSYTYANIIIDTESIDIDIHNNTGHLQLIMDMWSYLVSKIVILLIQTYTWKLESIYPY